MKKNTFLSRWEALKVETAAACDAIGNKVIEVTAEKYSRPGVTVRDEEKGRAFYWRVSAITRNGVICQDEEKGESLFFGWQELREWELFEVLNYAFGKDTGKGIKASKHYAQLCKGINQAFGAIVGDATDITLSGGMQLRFVRASGPMEIHRVGPWGVMLKDGGGEIWEDDFDMLDLESRCRLVDFLRTA